MFIFLATSTTCVFLLAFLKSRSQLIHPELIESLGWSGYLVDPVKLWLWANLRFPVALEGVSYSSFDFTWYVLKEVAYDIDLHLHRASSSKAFSWTLFQFGLELHNLIILVLYMKKQRSESDKWQSWNLNPHLLLANARTFLCTKNP